MINIYEYDLPIEVAAKLVTAKRDPLPLFKEGADMFDDDDLRKIADFLYAEVGSGAEDEFSDLDDEPGISVQQVSTGIIHLTATGEAESIKKIITGQVPKRGKWIVKDIDKGYVECPFCGSLTTCEYEEAISDLHYCFNCGAELAHAQE